MSINKIALILGVIVLAYSCNKENDTIQSRRNVDVTQNPNAVIFGNVAFFAEGKKELENATIELYGEVGCYENDLLLTTKTDQDGNYKINYNADLYERYSIRVSDESLDRQYLSEECISLQATNLECGNVIPSKNSETDFNIFKILKIQMDVTDSSQNQNISFGSLKAYQLCQCEREHDSGIDIGEGVITGDFSMGIHIAPPIKFEWTIKGEDGSYTSHEKIIHQTTDECETQELNINY